MSAAPATIGRHRSIPIAAHTAAAMRQTQNVTRTDARDECPHRAKRTHHGRAILGGESGMIARGLQVGIRAGDLGGEAGVREHQGMIGLQRLPRGKIGKFRE